MPQCSLMALIFSNLLKAYIKYSAHVFKPGNHWSTVHEQGRAVSFVHVMLGNYYEILFASHLIMFDCHSYVASSSQMQIESFGITIYCTRSM